MKRAGSLIAIPLLVHVRHIEIERERKVDREREIERELERQRERERLA